MTNTKALIFRRIPQGLPVAGQDLVVEQIPDGPSPISECPENGVLLGSVYSSIDPYQRGRMRDPSVKSYSPPLTLGEPINSRGIAEVLKSNSPRFRPGDLVIGMLPIQRYVAYYERRLGLIQLLQYPMGIEDIRVFLGALGIPGVTAFSGLYEIGKPQRGETIFISAASGAVGQMVGQLARLEGLRTIGSVGSDEKLQFITKELGFDAGFNYKKDKPSDALARLAPDGIDIYYDNVGGEHLDASLEHMKDFGRVIMCGTISEYNTAHKDRYPLRMSGNIFTRRLTVRGFVCSDKGFMDAYGKAHQELVSKLIKDGEIKTTTWEVEGIENSAQAFLDLFSGKNFGKAVLKY